MDCCYNRRKYDNYKKIYKSKSNIELENKKKKLIEEKNRDCIFAILYTTTATGAYIATAVTGGSVSIGTAPAGVLATVSAANSIDNYVTNSRKIEVIDNIINKRDYCQIKYIPNKNGLTIITISPKNKITKIKNITYNF